MTIKTSIVINDKELIIYSEQPKSILEVLVQAGIDIDAPCAGLGRCGKCRVYIQGELLPDEIERSVLSESEIISGIRLACRKRNMSDNIIVKIIQEQEKLPKTLQKIQPVDIGIAIDLGTTTIAIAFINLSNGTIIAMHSILNPQRLYGSDVISRIRSALDHLVLRKMKQTTINSITYEIKKMLFQLNLDTSNIKKIYIAGNTTMEHIIFGADVSSLAKSPYKPVFTESKSLGDLKITLGLKDVEVKLFPVIGGFVGGDTIASILACNMDLLDEPIALIDIGTNAEIGVGNRYAISTSSAPAGPAFEGGQIKNGMRAQSGAIEDMHIINDELKLYVKGNKEPEGICGSGLVRIVSELIMSGIVTPLGELLEPEMIPSNLSLKVVKKGNEYAFTLYKSFSKEIYLYQSDIRALQLAKASISAGLVLVSKQAGVKPKKIYIAGAFGNYLKTNDLILIGMIPSYLKESTYFIGDAVISGLKRFIINEPKVDIDKLLHITRHFELADDPSFNDTFLSMLEFKQKFENFI